MGNVMNMEQFVQDSGYGWEVQKLPIFVPDGEGGMLEVTNRKMTTRINDDGSMVPFEAVGNNFQVIQNTEAFQFLMDLSDSGELEIQRILDTQQGKMVIINTVLPGHMEIAGNAVATHVAFSNGHGGNGSAMSLAHNMQLCCTNQLTSLKLSTKFRYSIRHTRNAKMKLEDARAAMRLAFKQTEQLQDIADQLATDKLSKQSYNKFLRDIVQLDSINKDKQPRSYRRALGAREAIHTVIRDADYIGNYRNTKWALIQGVTDYTSNIQRTQQAEGTRFLSMAKGHPLTNRAYELLTA
jgi:phage/plasmid-like protein (TIGR03299 family)